MQTVLCVIFGNLYAAVCHSTRLILDGGIYIKFLILFSKIRYGDWANIHKA